MPIKDLLYLIKFKSPERPYKKIHYLAVVLFNPFTSVGKVIGELNFNAATSVTHRDQAEQILLSSYPIIDAAIKFDAIMSLYEKEFDFPPEVDIAYKELKAAVNLLSKPLKTHKWSGIMVGNRQQKKRDKGKGEDD